MYITAIHVPEFGERNSKGIIQGLGEMYEVAKDNHIPGFIQSLLLRELNGSALLLTFWRSRLDLEAFLQSETGKKIGEVQREVLSGKYDFSQYYTTWQAISNNEEFIRELLK